MVRVISVHHFANQNIQTVEQPTASVIASPHRLLLALPSHCIEVRDLSHGGEVLFTFPTVDEVTQIVHCLNGDYVATVETKYNRQNRETNFVRIYVNWDSVATMQQSKMTSSGVSLGSSECGMVQPMRARIAGRVTPTTNQSELGSLEMIEVPVKKNPHTIQCCQISGNLIVQAYKTLTVYAFEVKTHDISKLKFIDFEEMGLQIDLCFYPTQIAINENYIACSSNDVLHLFRVVSETKESVPEDPPQYSFKYNNDAPIDYKQLVRDEELHISKEKITVHLPTIVKENSMIHKHCPFIVCDRDIKATLRTTSNESKWCGHEIQDLIQLRLRPIVVECAQKQINEEFTCMLLKPMYVGTNLTKNVSSVQGKSKIFKSAHRKSLHSIACMITTQQEGYLYQFCDNDDTVKDIDHCISVYPFTAPVHKILMEEYLLHVITETGLESYTLRTGHHLCRHLETIDDINVTCPPVNESVCLVGIRAFLGLEDVLLSEKYLVLLANADSSPTHSVSSHGSSTAIYWTAYSLELPVPKTIFNDIHNVANVHKFTSLQMYCHLMEEAHMILRLSLVLSKWTTTDGNVSLVVPKRDNDDELIEAYRTSCALLGDHFILSPNEENYVLCLPYYRMAQVHPSEVLTRYRNSQEQANNYNTDGLLHYLKSVMFDLKSGPTTDRHFATGMRQNFSETIIEFFEKHSFDDLPNLVLKSNLLRTYSSDKLVNMLCDHTCRTSVRHREKTLALAILQVHRCNYGKARDLLTELGAEDLHDVLLENWELLFESVDTAGKSKVANTFSELTTVLMSVCPDTLSEILVNLIVEKRVLSLGKMLKIFLEYLPASVGSEGIKGSNVLQLSLEKYFKTFFSKYDNHELSTMSLERTTHDAMKLLVRSYLSQIQILQLREKVHSAGNFSEIKDKPSGKNSNVDGEETKTNVTGSKTDKVDESCGNKRNGQQPYFENKTFETTETQYLFSTLRYKYLDLLPPILDAGEGGHETTRNVELDLVLKKLQALLCSPVVPRQVIVEVDTFLNLNEDLRGHLGIRTIITNVPDALNVLLESFPKSLLQFGKDRFTKNDDWKLLIATVQSKIVGLCLDDTKKDECLKHKAILKDILMHIASTLNLDQLLDVFPQKMKSDTTNDKQKKPNGGFPTADGDKEESKATNVPTSDGPKTNNDVSDDILSDIENYEPYIQICKEIMHANQIRKLIITTSQQLLTTLKL